MPSSTQFPNGQQLDSTALTPDDINVIFQPLVISIFGMTVDPKNPSAAYSAVRVGWQQEGQPFGGIGEDTCILTSTPVGSKFSEVRDKANRPNDDPNNPTDQTILNQVMWFTQIWEVHFVLYGPNCMNRARLLVSAFALDWVHDKLTESTLYAIPEWKRPVYAPENFQGQWWKRADVRLRFSELVVQQISVPTADSSTIILLTDTGQTETVNIDLEPLE